MESIRDKMQAFESKIAANEQELVALRSACDEYKADNEALKAALDVAKADKEALEAQKAEMEKSFAEQIQAKDESLAEALAERDEMKAKMELVPLADADAGREPVADGSVGGDDVDLVAEMNKLPLGSAEQIAFYRANKKEIDASYKK